MGGGDLNVVADHTGEVITTADGEAAGNDVAVGLSMALNIGFNALGAVLSLFTFLSVVPFLRILFMPSGPAAADAGEASGLLDTITSGFDALVVTHGTERALVLLCVAIVVLAVVKPF